MGVVRTNLRHTHTFCANHDIENSTVIPHRYMCVCTLCAFPYNNYAGFVVSAFRHVSNHAVAACMCS